MNWHLVEQNWPRMAGALQQQWGKLSTSDLGGIRGRRARLAVKIREKYGLSTDQADRQIEAWLSRLPGYPGELT